MRRKKLIIIAVAAIVILLSVVTIVQYEFYSPFPNNWQTSAVPGYISSAIFGKDAIYVLSQTYMTPLNPTYNLFSVSKATGQINWESSNIITSGAASCCLLESEPSTAPVILYLFNNTLYASYLNGGPENLNSYHILSYNLTSGVLENSYVYNSSDFQKYADFGASIFPFGNSFILNYLIQNGFNSSPSLGNETIFRVIQFKLSPTIEATSLQNITLTGTVDGWGTGDEQVSISDDKLVSILDPYNKTIIINLDNNSFYEPNFVGNYLGVVGSNLFYSSAISGENITVNILDLETLQVIHTFSLKDPFYLANTNYEIFPLTSSRIVLITSDCCVGAASSDRPSTVFQGFDVDGTSLWNITPLANSAGTFAFTYPLQSGEILLGTMPGGYSYDSNYHSSFYVLNYTDGNLISQKTYNFWVDYPSFKAPWWGPPPFNGVIATNGSLVLYKLGSSLALATVN